MKLIKKLFGISTKNLYLLRYYVYDNVKFYSDGTIWNSGYEYNMRDTDNYVLAREKYGKYVDVFTNTKHNTRVDYPSNGDIAARVVSPIITANGRISYKDAEEILETKNCYHKKK